MTKRSLPLKFQPVRRLMLVAVALLVYACATHTDPADRQAQTVIVSVIGTNDVHGQLLPQSNRGGLAVFSGYVNALRSARSADNGGVLLIDAGDMWQGTLESNLSEGAVMVDAYNQLGYTAATIGNHEFDFGPAGERSTPASNSDDARGALKLRAAEANFPLLAANLIDLDTGQPVAWPNVQPATMTEVAGVKVGIIGVMTIDALDATIAANVYGLRVDPLADTIIREAVKLRASGATLVIVTAHAGGSCTRFDDPYDLSSCEPDQEIMQVARALPTGLVDQIIAGHQHRGIAHVVNGVAITASFSSTRSFGRVDFTVDKTQARIKHRKVFAPQRPCPLTNASNKQCAWSTDEQLLLEPAIYEGQIVKADPAVAAIANRAKLQAQALKAKRLGVYLDGPITLEHKPESALGNLMTDALLETSRADISLHNVSGGIRANLTSGELTFGKVYQMFPFDNRVVVLELTGRDMRRIIAGQAHKREKRAGFSGMSVFVECNDQRMSVRMVRKNGHEIHDDEIIKLAVNDFLALGGDGILAPVIPAGGFEYPSDTPLARDALVDWLTMQGGTLRAEQFVGENNQRWHMSDMIPPNCSL